MLTGILAILFCLALGATISTYVWQGKRWWGTRGYRVRIVRRTASVALGVMFVLLLSLGLGLRNNEPATKNAPVPNETIEGAGSPNPTTIGGVNIAESPAPEATGATNPNVGYYCGTERLPVKTLSDEDRNRVNLKPVPATVAALDALPRPALLPDNRRAAPVELTTYTVRAVLLEIRDEADHDLHLVIADPGDQHKTMIAEIVDPGCSGAIASRDVADLRRVRENFDRTYNPPPGQKYWPKPGDVMEITGVGFFDFEHGQSGVAPNAIELHPVLDVRRIDN
jgi:hypothetical protein